MNGGVAFWIEAAMAVLLMLSGVFVVISAIGFLRRSAALSRESGRR